MNAVMNKTEEMRVYVADLSAYNNGILSGSWIDLPSADITAEVQEVLNQGTNDRRAEGVYDGYDSEEWAIHDYELPFNIGEYEDLDKLNDIATRFDSLDGSDIKKVSYLIDYQGASIDEALEQYENVDIYENMSYLELACEFIDETWNVPEHLQSYIDYERFARELEFEYAQIGNDLYFSQY